MKQWLCTCIALSICTFSLLAGDEASKKQVLVTGGAGFLGSHLCERLLLEGSAVICIDNLQTGRLKNIEHLFENPNFKFIQEDVTKLSDPGIKLDEIYNLACPASPPRYQLDPVHTVLTNIIGSYNLLELAKKYKAKIFQASTSEVYGDPLEHPQKESYRGNVNPDGPRSCYDEGKRCAETLFFDYHGKYGVVIKVARIFNTYGPRMDPYDGRVVSNLIVQAISNLPMTIYGDGSQTRSFCYVTDLIDGFILLMNTEDTFTGPVNLGNPSEFTIIELADKLIAKTHTSSTITFEPLPIDDPRKRLPDISLAREVLGWTPKVSLNEGLDATIQYFKEETGL